MQNFSFSYTQTCGKSLTVGQKAASSSSLSLASPDAAPWMGLRRTAQQAREGINNLSGTDSRANEGPMRRLH